MTELTKLPHTGLEVPHTRYRLTDFHDSPTHNGIAFSATVTEDERRVGTIENQGNGGGTWFFQRTAEDRQAMEEFTAACRMNGKPLRDEEVYDRLIDEHDLGQEAARCQHERKSLLRGVDENGEWNSNTVIVALPPIWLTRTDSPFLPRLTRALDNHQPRASAWELWNGNQWQTLNRPTATE